MLKFALIGLGVMGKNHYRALQNVAGVQIVALCEPFCKENFAQKIYTELDEMLDSESKSPFAQMPRTLKFYLRKLSGEI